MKIGVFDNGWFKGACKALGHDPILLPLPSGPGGNGYAADIAARRANGTAIVEQLSGAGPDLMLDNGGGGIAFVSGAGGGDVRLAHEALGVPLYSHFIDPLVTAFQGLGWPTLWQCLKSDRWVKAVWDQAQVTELLRFGVPKVIHLPMAAPDRPYNTEPLDPNHCKHAVSFVGGQNTSYFTSNANMGTGNLFAGTLASAVRSDLLGANFYDVYYDLYGLAEPVQPTDDLQTQINKTLAYFNAKLFFNASLCVRNRDRFVIFLKRKLGEKFHLIGRGWETAYGLPVEPPLPDQDSFFNHFRETAININLVNGNAETGLNMRHFEITAAGGFMLCYDQPEIEEHFEVGRECDVFHSEAELLEKIQYYLSRPQERVEIALAGQKRTLSSHLYRHRLQSIIDHANANGLRSSPVEFSTGKWTDECKKLLPEPDVILDCGANVGYVSEFLRRMYPKAEIFAFEPVSSVYEQLSFRAAEHGFHAVKKAVGDFDGRTVINLTQSPECHSLLGFKEGNPCAQWTQVVDKEEVEVCTLDRWCHESGIAHHRVDLLKLDIQGAELKALHGAKKILETAKLVYLEVSFVEIYKDCPLFEEIDAFLKECGYRRQAVYPSDQPHNWGDALYVKA